MAPGSQRARSSSLPEPNTASCRLKICPALKEPAFIMGQLLLRRSCVAAKKSSWLGVEIPRARPLFFLAQRTKHVYMLVRGPGLTDTMSKYLIRRIEQTPNISLLTHTEVVSLKGVDHLEGVTWRNSKSGKTAEKSIAH